MDDALYKFTYLLTYFDISSLEHREKSNIVCRILLTKRTGLLKHFAMTTLLAEYEKKYDSHRFVDFPVFTPFDWKQTFAIFSLIALSFVILFSVSCSLFLSSHPLTRVPS